MKGRNILHFLYPPMKRKILMVCLGNICRSPLAHGILESKLSEDFEVDSAGTIDMHKGKQPDHRSIAVARKHQLNISQQKSRPITYQDLENYDEIFCMDSNNLENVRSMAKNEHQKQKIKLILDPELDQATEVPDPYWGTAEDFERVYQMLDKACERIAKDLNEKQIQN